jgi:hypothetical protein
LKGEQMVKEKDEIWNMKNPYLSISKEYFHDDKIRNPPYILTKNFILPDEDQDSLERRI